MVCPIVQTGKMKSYAVRRAFLSCPKPQAFKERYLTGLFSPHWGKTALATGIILGAMALTQAHAGPDLLSHRAVYDLKLHDVAPNSTLSSAQGRLVIDLHKSCGGWASLSRMLVKISDSEGQGHTIDHRYESLESFDAKDFSFERVTYDQNDQPDLKSGFAERRAGQINVAETNGEMDYTATLPESVLFPTQLTQTLLRQAEGKGGFFDYALYDGHDEEGKAQPVSVWIGSSVSPDVPDTVPSSFKALDGAKGWPVTLSFFSPHVKDSPPDYILSMTLLHNGVVTDPLFDYGQFQLKGRLVTLDPVKDQLSNCPS
jgi:hypothetical protein